jgi:hypothetical protein
LYQKRAYPANRIISPLNDPVFCAQILLLEKWIKSFENPLFLQLSSIWNVLRGNAEEIQRKRPFASAVSCTKVAGILLHFWRNENAKMGSALFIVCDVSGSYSGRLRFG